MRLFFALLCLAVPCAGWTQSPLPFTVNDAVTAAISANPRLRVTVQEIRAAQSGVRAAAALDNPTFYIAPALGNNNGTTEDLLFSQPLELNGTRSARRGVADAQRRVTEANALVELRTVVASVKSAYYELVRGQEQAALARALLESAQELDRLTRRQVELGSRPGIEQTQTGLEAARAAQQVILADSQVQVAQSALNTQMGRDPETLIGTLPPLTLPPAAPESPPLGTQALASRAELSAVRAAQDRFRQEARLARAQGRPDLAPQFRVQQFGTENYGFSLAVSLPIFDHGSRRNRIRQADDSARAQEFRLTATQNEIRQQVAQALIKLRAAQTVARSYPQGVLDSAKKLLDGARKGFQTGAAGVTLLSVLEAQRTYRAVQSEYLNALVNAAQAQAELEQAVGSVPAELLRSVPVEPMPQGGKSK